MPSSNRQYSLDKFVQQRAICITLSIFYRVVAEVAVELFGALQYIAARKLAIRDREEVSRYLPMFGGLRCNRSHITDS